MLLKYEIISMRIRSCIRLRNNIDFSETSSTFQMISNFLKNPVDLDVCAG